jgi:hypothetical protein
VSECGVSECGVSDCGLSECGVSECGVSECGVSECDCELSIMKGPCSCAMAGWRELKYFSFGRIYHKILCPYIKFGYYAYHSPVDCNTINSRLLT